MSEPRTDEQGEPLASFLIALPPGWARLPAKVGDRPLLRLAIDEIIAEALPSSLPRERAEPWRGEMRKRLTGVVLEADEAGATAIYLPVRNVDGVSIPASIIESELDDDEQEDPETVITDTVRGFPGGSRHTVDGARAARTDRTLTQVQPPGDWPEVTNRQIVYTIEVPHRPGRWIVMSFSAVSGDGQTGAFAEALVYLFDALMTTFRWSDVLGAEPTALETRLDEVYSTASMESIS